MLDLVRLHTFTTVIASGSFSEAARVLHISQPAVSRQIAQLERQLRTSLLIRNRGGVQVTPAGRLLLDHANAVIDRLALAETQVRAMITEQTGTVRLGSFFSALVQLSSAVGTLTGEQHPELRITDDLVDRETAYAKLGRGELDLAVIFEYDFEPATTPENLTVRTLFDDPIRVLLPADHNRAEVAEITPAELADDTWIHPRDGGAATLAEHVLTRHQLDPPRLLAGHGDEPVEIQPLVASGRGIALTHDLTVILDPGGVAVRALTTDTGTRHIAAAHASGPLSPATELVLNTLLQMENHRSR